MNKCKFSVLVLQYNPVYEMLEKTILSIIEQKNIDFEVVIADDGSREDHFEKVVQIFEKYNFTKYILVKNEQNQGTVKNIISGLEKCNGEYLKCISPGDYLYNEDVLSLVYKKMIESHAGLLFGKMAFYKCADNDIKIYNEKRPYLTEVYKTDDSLKMRKHLLIYQDNISGASAFVRRSLFVELMNGIEGAVIFQEDVAFSMLTFMNEKILYIEEYIVWYEYGEGVSTSGENKWIKILQKDTLNYYYVLDKLYHNEKYIKRAIFFQKLEMKKGKIWKMLKNILYLDRYLFRRKHIVSQLNLKEQPEKSYLEKLQRKEREYNAGY